MQQNRNLQFVFAFLEETNGDGCHEKTVEQHIISLCDYGEIPWRAYRSPFVCSFDVRRASVCCTSTVLSTVSSRRTRRLSPELFRVQDEVSSRVKTKTLS